MGVTVVTEETVVSSGYLDFTSIFSYHLSLREEVTATFSYKEGEYTV